MKEEGISNACDASWPLTPLLAVAEENEYRLIIGGADILCLDPHPVSYKALQDMFLEAEAVLRDPYQTLQLVVIFVPWDQAADFIFGDFPVHEP